MNIATPNIFLNHSLIAGYTQINSGIDSSLVRGLNFRFEDELEYNKSKQLLAEQNKITVDQVKIPDQNHGTEVAIVDEFSNTEILTVDTLITNKPGVMLGSKSADCCVVLLFDPVKKIIASVHSGRRGTQKNIVAATISKMQNTFGVDPSNLLAYLSPAASKATYTVDSSIADSWPSQFKQQFRDELIQDLDPKTRDFVLMEVSKSKPGNSYFLDIPSKIINDLVSIGLKPDNIENCKIDTISNNLYHSYRRDGKNCGLGLGYIMLTVN